MRRVRKTKLTLHHVTSLIIRLLVERSDSTSYWLQTRTDEGKLKQT